MTIEPLILWRVTQSVAENGEENLALAIVRLVIASQKIGIIRKIFPHL